MLSSSITNSKFCIFSGMLNVWPACSEWPKQCNITQDPMHGGAFNGNACRLLLAKVDILQSMSPIQVQPFVEAFRAFAEVVKSCFGTELLPSYLDCINNFKTKYTDLADLNYVNITPKIHAIFFHVPEFCSKENTGLGRHSEQASESVHASFKSTFKRYKVGTAHDDYATHLMRAVMDYNCGHL